MFKRARDGSDDRVQAHHANSTVNTKIERKAKQCQCNNNNNINKCNNIDSKQMTHVVNNQTTVAAQPQKTKVSHLKVSERVAQSERRFNVYIASWRDDVQSERQHGSAVLRKPSSLPPLTPLPLLLTAQHISLFSQKDANVKPLQLQQRKQQSQVQQLKKHFHQKDDIHDCSTRTCNNNKNNINNNVQTCINKLVHNFFHTTSTFTPSLRNKSKNTNIKSSSDNKCKQFPLRTGVIYDTAMYAHRSSNLRQYERPLRLQRAIEHLQAIQLLQCCTVLPSRLASSRELRLAHSRSLIDYVDQIDFVIAIKTNPVSSMSLRNEQQQTVKNEQHNNNYYYYQNTSAVQSYEIGQDLYACAQTSRVARLAAGCAIEAGLAVWQGKVANAFALVRPPGHHAMREAAKGFCFFNNVAVAVRAVQAFAQKTSVDNNAIVNNKLQSEKSSCYQRQQVQNQHKQKQQRQNYEKQKKQCVSTNQKQQSRVKIMIIDWDVHHCDGTEDIFYNDDSVLVISIHQHGNKRGHILRKMPTEMKHLNNNSINTNTTISMSNDKLPHLQEIKQIKTGQVSVSDNEYVSLDAIALLMSNTASQIEPGDVTAKANNINTVNINAVNNNVNTSVFHDKQKNEEVFTTTRQSTRRRGNVDYNKLAQQLDKQNKYKTENNNDNKKSMQDVDIAAAAMFGVDLRHNKRQQQALHNSNSSSSSNSSTSSVSSSSDFSSSFADVAKKDTKGHNVVHLEGDSAGASFDSFTSSSSSTVSCTSFHDYHHNNNNHYIINNDNNTNNENINMTSSKIGANDKSNQLININKSASGSNDTQQGSYVDNKNVKVITSKCNTSNYDQDIKQSDKTAKINVIMQQQQQRKVQINKQKPQQQKQQQQQEQLFYPASGHLYRIGGDVQHSARGRNVNIPWPTHGMGDVQYMRLFYELILPVATQFSPHMVFVSCGFDSAANDLLGSMRLTPSGYYLLTKLLLQHFPRLVVVLQGGYNARNVALGSEAVLRALLESSGTTQATLPHSRMLWSQTGKLIRQIRHTHAPYWHCFRSHAQHQ